VKLRDPDMSASAQPHTAHSASTRWAGLDVTPQQTQGPFFVDAPERSNITEGHPGALLLLTLLIVDVTGAACPAGIKVDLWAADASGSYSSFVQNPGNGHLVDHRGKRFMRGCQRTDANGSVVFHSIVPGWYSGRTTHMHVMVRGDGGRPLLTTQLYFSQSLLAEVSQLEPYKHRGHPDTNYKDDMVIGGNLDNLALLTLKDKKDHPGRYHATHVLKINRELGSTASSSPI
jgi:protocatechuate 3,4-dioxygenase beta subunit